MNQCVSTHTHMDCARYAHLTLELRRRHAERQQQRAPHSRAIPELRARLLEHLESNGGVRQPLPGGALALKRMISKTVRVVTEEHVEQALEHALAAGTDAMIVDAFKQALLQQVTAWHVYADVVEVDTKRDRSKCYAGECTEDEMRSLEELDPRHPAHQGVLELMAARAALEQLGRVDEATVQLQREHAELQPIVLAELAKGGHVVTVGQQRMSLHRRQARRKPRLSAATYAEQLGHALALVRAAGNGVLVPGLVGPALARAMDEHVQRHTTVVDTPRLVVHR